MIKRNAQDKYTVVTKRTKLRAGDLITWRAGDGMSEFWTVFISQEWPDTIWYLDPHGKISRGYLVTEKYLPQRMIRKR